MGEKRTKCFTHLPCTTEFLKVQKLYKESHQQIRSLVQILRCIWLIHCSVLNCQLSLICCFMRAWRLLALQKRYPRSRFYISLGNDRILQYFIHISRWISLPLDVKRIWFRLIMKNEIYFKKRPFNKANIILNNMWIKTGIGNLWSTSC